MKISVVLIVKNEAKYIKDCLDALFRQTVRDFEIVVIDNGSTDGTGEIIGGFSDERIRSFHAPALQGVAELRNRGVEKAAGDYIFFTDGDCVPNRHWLEEGLNALESKEYVGVEGKTYYEAPQMVTVSDWNVRQLVPGEYMTCNVAYSRSVLEKVNLFDPAFQHGHEDRDLAFRVLKHGRIFFSQEMIVSHQRKKLTVKALFHRARRAENKVYFIKKHGRPAGMAGMFLYPQRLLAIACPPLLFLTSSYRSPYEILLGFLKYFSYIYERLLIWRGAVKHRILVL